MRVAIIGAGMAGASLAAELAPHADITMLEAEDHPGYHSTGRSAAFWSESYGGPLVQPLTTASGPLLEALGVLGVRGALHIADRDGADALAAFAAEFEGSVVALAGKDRAALETEIPGLRPRWNRGVAEPTCRDIDVAALHAACLRRAKQSGARLLTHARVKSMVRVDDWTLQTTAGAISADVVVNAAGAWADEVAAMAGATATGIAPYRRTIVQVRVDPPAPAAMPLVIDAAGAFYFKPETGGRLWLSPHDETPCPAADCVAEEVDVATAIARLQSVVDWRVEAVERAWAGLRSFAPDRLPVYGYDPVSPGFFWCAGQGGFGIQTAPAAAKLAAALLLDSPPDPSVAAIDPAPYLASRFAN